MTTIEKQKIQDNGLLAELAYLRIENYQSSISNTNELKKFIENNPETITGISENRKDKIISLLDTYEIVKTSKSSFTDFQGTLVKNKETGKCSILFRGTELDKPGDILTDVELINNVNMQYHDAKNFVNEVLNDNDLNKSNTPEDESLLLRLKYKSINYSF